ncbi:MAG: hypothetical protein IT292_01070 [Deltaproteobacteria bacterium]|nr:hypothetical protein [Deltaproteobacteria bacterium]
MTSQIPAGEKYYLDIPEINQAALNLVQKRKMNKVFATARMYNKGEPDLPLVEMDNMLFLAPSRPILLAFMETGAEQIMLEIW